MPQLLLHTVENVLQLDYPSSDAPSTPFYERGDDSLDSSIPPQYPFGILPSCLLVTPRFLPRSFDPSQLCPDCLCPSIPRSSPAFLVSAQEQCPRQLRGPTLFGQQGESPASDRMSGAAHHLGCGDLCYEEADWGYQVNCQRSRCGFARATHCEHGPRVLVSSPWDI